MVEVLKEAEETRVSTRGQIIGASIRYRKNARRLGRSRKNERG